MIQRYRFLRQKTFESIDKFELRLNEETRKGWKALNVSNSGGGTLLVLLERES